MDDSGTEMELDVVSEPPQEEKQMNLEDLPKDDSIKQNGGEVGDTFKIPSLPSAGNSVKRHISLDDLSFEFVKELTDAATVKAAYSCKQCEERVGFRYFNEEERYIHKEKAHDQDYDVEKNMQIHLVLACSKCPFIVLPVEDWEAHLDQHLLSSLWNN